MQFLTTIWIFIQDQILGMKWLSLLIGEFLPLMIKVAYTTAIVATAFLILFMM